MIKWETCGDGESVVANESILAPFEFEGFALNGVLIHFHICKVGSPSVPFQLFVADMNGNSRQRFSVASIDEGKAKAEAIVKAARGFYL